MKLRIQSVNFDATAQLEEYVNRKVSKMEKFFDEVLTIDVYLKVIKPETANNKETDIKVSIPSVEFFASKTCDTFEEGVDLAIEAIEKQIRKHKEKTSKK